jgi:hypothetical protein
MWRCAIRATTSTNVATPTVRARQAPATQPLQRAYLHATFVKLRKQKCLNTHTHTAPRRRCSAPPRCPCSFKTNRCLSATDRGELPVLHTFSIWTRATRQSAVPRVHACYHTRCPHHLLLRAHHYTLHSETARLSLVAEHDTLFRPTNATTTLILKCTCKRAIYRSFSAVSLRECTPQPNQRHYILGAAARDVDARAWGRMLHWRRVRRWRVHKIHTADCVTASIYYVHSHGGSECRMSAHVQLIIFRVRPHCSEVAGMHL